MLPSTVNGTDLGAQEWRDALFLRYCLEPPDLPKYCDGCQARLSISHALDCKKGGLVTARHNKLRGGVADLAGKAFTPSHVRDNPVIYSGCAVRRTKPTLAGLNKTKPSEKPAASEVTEHKGDLLIWYLYDQGTNSVHDMRVVNTDALAYQSKAVEKFLHEAEKGKKKMYLKACLQQRWHFSPFVSSVEGLLGSLHADPVCWHPGSSDAEMGGAHQGDCNPTLDVSTRL